MLGSSNIGVWDWVSYINVYPQVIFGKDQHIETGMTQVKLVNQDLKWEELSQMNAGFDATLLIITWICHLIIILKQQKTFLLECRY